MRSPAAVTLLVLVLLPLTALADPAPAPTCPKTVWKKLSDDPGARGPWTVGARTVTIAGASVEVFYPARPGSAKKVPSKRYDLRVFMPAAEAAKVPDAENAYQSCDCHDGLPVDGKAGPYPVIFFFHGAASFPTQSAILATHWASRGFVVIAPALPLVGLRDALGEKTTGNPVEVARAMLAAVTAGDPALAFLDGRLQKDRFAVAGHSMGSGFAARLADDAGVEVLVPPSPGGVGPPNAAVAVGARGGPTHAIIPWARTAKLFETATRAGTAARAVHLVGLEKAGHLAFTDICVIGRDQGGMLAVAKKYGVKVP